MNESYHKSGKFPPFTRDHDPFLSSTPVSSFHLVRDMSQQSPSVSRPRNTPRRRLVSTHSVSWSREREVEILSQKLNSRLVELEKDGAEVVKELGKLGTRVEAMLDEVRLAVANMTDKEDLRKSYQEVSKVIVEAEDYIALLAASFVRWQGSRGDSGENIGDTEEVMENVIVAEIKEKIFENQNEELTDVANQLMIDAEAIGYEKQSYKIETEERKKNQVISCETETSLKSTSERGDLIIAQYQFRDTWRYLSENVPLKIVTKDKPLSEVNMEICSEEFSSPQEESLFNLKNSCYQPDSSEMPPDNSQVLSYKYKAMLFNSDGVEAETPEQNYSRLSRSDHHDARDKSKESKLKTHSDNLTTLKTARGINRDRKDASQDVNKKMSEHLNTKKTFKVQILSNGKCVQSTETAGCIQDTETPVPDTKCTRANKTAHLEKSKFSEPNNQIPSTEKLMEKSNQIVDLEIGLGEEASNHHDNILTNQERHRTSLLNDIGKSLLHIQKGYAGVLHFMEGCPSLFWVYNESRGLSELQNYLEHRYGQGEGDGGGDGLDVGSLVLAKYSQDGRYFRARVEAVVLEDADPMEIMYSVCYVDYGNSEAVSGSEMKAWDKGLDVVPEQAVSCCLAEGPTQWREDRGAQGQGAWTPQQLEAFQRVMKRGELRVELVNHARKEADPRKPMFEALVWLDGINLMQILKREPVFAEDLASWEPAKQEFPVNISVSGQASELTAVKPLRRPFTATALDPTVSPFVPTKLELSQVHPDPATLEKAEGKVAEWILNKCQVTAVSLSGHTIHDEAKSDCSEEEKIPPASTTLHNIATVQVEVDENDCFTFFLSFVENPGQFYVHPVQDDLSRLDDIHEELQNHSLLRPEERLLVVGTSWAMFDQSQNKWRRVRIEKQEDSFVTVRHIDFGDIQHNVQCDVLRRLPDTWVCETPAMAVKCHLALCFSKGDDWDPESSILLGESLAYEKQCSATVIEGEEPLGVVLCVNDIIINQKMVEWGFAESRVDFADIINNNLPPGWDPMEDAFVANENNYETNQEDIEMAMTGYRSKNMVCPQFELNGSCFRGEFCEMQHNAIDRPSAVTYDKEDIAVETREEQLELCPGKCVSVKVSHQLVSPSSFYCTLDPHLRIPQLISGADTFEWFSGEMQLFYKDKTRMDLLAAPAVGELVACRNPANNLWSRGRVVVDESEVHKEDECRDGNNANIDANQVSVFFVDCGFTEQVEVSEVRRLDPCFTAFPLQAVECCLAGVRPSREVWSLEANKEFLRIVQHQWIKAQIVSFDSDRMILDLIKPQNPEDDINVAEELKKLNLAKPAQFIHSKILQKEMRLPG